MSAPDEKFLALSDLLTAGRDDRRLGEVILGTYDKIQAHPDPRAFLEDVRAGLYARGMDTPHGRVLMEQAKAAALHGMAFLETAIGEVTGVDIVEGAYLPALESDLAQAKALLDALMAHDWDRSVEASRNISFARLGSTRKFDDKEFLEGVKKLREEWKAVAKAIHDRWLTETAAEAEFDRGLTAPALFALIDAVNAFDDAFSAAKRSRNAADFNDLEHFAVRLLYDGGAPSALAKTLSAQYAEDRRWTSIRTRTPCRTRSSVRSRKTRAICSWSAMSSRASTASALRTRRSSSRNTARSPMLRRQRRVRRAASSSAAISARAGQCSRRATISFRAVMGETVGDLVYTDREALHLGAEYYPQAGDKRYRTEVLLADTAGGRRGCSPKRPSLRRGSWRSA